MIVQILVAVFPQGLESSSKITNFMIYIYVHKNIKICSTIYIDVIRICILYIDSINNIHIIHIN